MAAAEVIESCRWLSKADGMRVMQLLISEQVKMSEGGDGIRINLDSLSPEQLQRLLVFVRGLKQVQLIRLD